MAHDAPLAVAKAMDSVAAVRTILLSETRSELTGEQEVAPPPRKVDRCLGITQLFPRQRVSGIPVVNEASG